MKKQEFKKAYGEYRKMVSGAFYRGVQAYREAINTNQVFRACFFRKPLPTSVAVSNYLSSWS
jgi:hypothetical protein